MTSDGDKRTPRAAGAMGMILSGLLPVIAGGIGAWAGAAWKSPELWFQVRLLEQSGEKAKVRVTLRNYGRSVARDIRLSARFPTALVRAPESDDLTTPAVLRRGGEKHCFAAVSLDRLVPGQKVSVTFVMQGPLSDETENKFVEVVAYEEGLASEGVPILPTVVVLSALAFAFYLVLMFWLRSLLGMVALLSHVIPKAEAGG